MSEQPNLFDADRPHARRTDPVTSDRTVKSIAKDGTLAYYVWTYAFLKRAQEEPFNDTELTEWIERATCKRQQRNVIARARGLMEDAGLLRQVGIFYHQGRELMHYAIDPNNPKEKQ